MQSHLIRIFLTFAVHVALIAPLSSAQETPPVTQVSKFSGEPVPRFASLRFSAVHGRQGPSLDHAILWRYEAEGMPVLIIRETHGWRRVRDQDGDEVWVQARMLSGARTAVTTRQTTLHRRADPESSARAMIKAGVIATLDDCKAGWCKVEIGKRKGWLKESDLWGTRFGTDGV
ncbi:MAG: SH3 domain-containing protein [Pseudomonadota bacterium]